jgi:hypothetical protein
MVIPILSLVIAVLAVFVGPVITLKIGRKQVELSRRIASKQIVAPMRQAWINTFRNKLAELTGSAIHNFDNRSPATMGLKDEERRRLTQLEQEIELLINPTEVDHRELIAAIRDMLTALEGDPPYDRFPSDQESALFDSSLAKATTLGQKIFKAEWDRIKNDIEKP